MSKRNFILLILVLMISTIAVIGFLYLQKTPVVPPDYGNTPTNFISQFNPFGSSGQNTETKKPPVNVSGYVPENQPEIQNKLTKISTMPIAGFAIFMKERLKEIPKTETVDMQDETAGSKDEVVIENNKKENGKPTGKPTPPPTEFALALRYVEKISGSVFQTFVDKLEERKFVETSIPRIYDAYWSSDGKTVVMRHLKSDEATIETFVGTMPKEYLGGDATESAKVSGYFLPDDIKDLSLSPDRKKIFYLFNSGDREIGTILNFSDNLPAGKAGKKSQIFDSPFTEWLAWWGNDKFITLTTKPSSNALGYAYNINTAKGGLTQLLNNISGLTTLPGPDGKTILYGDSTLSLYTYDMSAKNSSTQGLKTLPEKCVWSGDSNTIFCAVPKSIPVGSYPDSWYRGEVSFSDQFWKIDLKSGNTTLLFDPGSISGGESIDGVKLSLDPDENYLFFINKKDSFLWKLDLK